MGLALLRLEALGHKGPKLVVVWQLTHPFMGLCRWQLQHTDTGVRLEWLADIV